MATFSERLKQLRKDKKLTQKELAQKFFLDDSSISKYENGKAVPETELLQSLSDFFEVSVDYLLGRSNIKNYLDDSNVTIALHSDETSFDYSDLSDEAKKEVQDFIEYVRHKYKDK